MKAVSWLMVVAACVLVAAGLGYYKYRQIQAAMAFGASFPEPVEAVEAAIVREELWQPTTAVTGDVRAIQTVDVSTELAGRIVEVGFAPGASVSQGQLLVRLDTSEERAQRAAAEAAAELARLALSRNERLMRSGAAAEEAGTLIWIETTELGLLEEPEKGARFEQALRHHIAASIGDRPVHFEFAWLDFVDLPRGR